MIEVDRILRGPHGRNSHKNNQRRIENGQIGTIFYIELGPPAKNSPSAGNNLETMMGVTWGDVGSLRVPKAFRLAGVLDAWELRSCYVVAPGRTQVYRCAGRPLREQQVMQ